MRLTEILREDYTANLVSDLNDLLINAKGAGNTEISLPILLSQLSGMGYSVDYAGILPVLQQNPVVMNVTPDKVSLKDMTQLPGDSNDSQEQVSKLAQKATKIK